MRTISLSDASIYDFINIMDSSEEEILSVEQICKSGTNIANIEYKGYVTPIYCPNNSSNVAIDGTTILSVNNKLQVGTILSSQVKDLGKIVASQTKVDEKTIVKNSNSVISVGRIDKSQIDNFGSYLTSSVTLSQINNNEITGYAKATEIPTKLTWDKIVLNESFTFQGNYTIGNKTITPDSPLIFPPNSSLKYIFEQLFNSNPPVYYTVKFYNGSELCSTQSIEHGKDATPPIFNRLGYYEPTWDPVCTNITADTSCYSVWTDPIEYPITYELNGHGTAPSKTTYNVTEEYAPSALTAEGQTFNGWTPTKIDFGETGAKTFTASWIPIPIETFTITVNCDETKGSVEGGGIYQKDACATIIATPKSGYKFKQWTKDGSQVTTNASYSFTATENATYVAEFEEATAEYKYFIVTKFNSSELSEVTDENIEQQCNNHKYASKPTVLEFEVDGNSTGIIAIYAKKTENVTLVAIGTNTLFKNTTRSLNNYDCFECHDDEAGISIAKDSVITIN